MKCDYRIKNTQSAAALKIISPETTGFIKVIRGI